MLDSLDRHFLTFLVDRDVSEYWEEIVLREKLYRNAHPLYPRSDPLVCTFNYTSVPMVHETVEVQKFPGRVLEKYRENARVLQTGGLTSPLISVAIHLEGSVEDIGCSNLFSILIRSKKASGQLVGCTFFQLKDCV